MIPDKKLEITLDTKRMKLRELGRIVDKLDGGNPINAILEFLDAYSNWTEAEIDELTVEDAASVGEQVKAAIQTMMGSQAVPLASSPSSKTGPG